MRLTKSRIERPTRRASAHAIFRLLDFSLASFFSMKKRATPRLAKMAAKAIMKPYFMGGIIA